MTERGIRYIVRDGVSESVSDTLVREKLSFQNYIQGNDTWGKENII